MPRPLSARGMAMLADLPPVLRESPDYEAVIHCYAREFDRIEETMEQLRAQFNPATADVALREHERQLRLPVGGFGQTLAQRQQAVLTRYKKLKGTSEGREWEDQVTGILGSGWSYQEHTATNGVPEDTIRVTMPYGPTSDRYLDALVQLREITAAHLEIEFESSEGFVLDVSRLDLESFGGN